MWQYSFGFVKFTYFSFLFLYIFHVHDQNSPTCPTGSSHFRYHPRSEILELLLLPLADTFTSHSEKIITDKGKERKEEMGNYM